MVSWLDFKLDTQVFKLYPRALIKYLDTIATKFLGVNLIENTNILFINPETTTLFPSIKAL